MVKVAVEAMLGKKLKDLEYGTGLRKNKNFYAVKLPVFSTEKLSNVDTFLSPEMKSTGEVLGVDQDFDVAVYKGFSAVGMKIPTDGKLYVSLNNVSKDMELETIRKYKEIGFSVSASKGTADYLNKNGVEAEYIQGEHLKELISDGIINLIINTPTIGDNKSRYGFGIRRKASEYRIPAFTSIDTASLFIKAIEVKKSNKSVTYNHMKYYLGL